MSSGAHKSAERIDFNNLRIETSYNPEREYAISKLACLQFMVELKKRIEINGDKIISTAAHPGV
ncbi:MAG: short-chain dehydrogenase, partial [Sphingobacteriales bacterium]